MKLKLAWFPSTQHHRGRHAVWVKTGSVPSLPGPPPPHTLPSLQEPHFYHIHLFLIWANCPLKVMVGMSWESALSSTLHTGFIFLWYKTRLSRGQSSLVQWFHDIARVPAPPTFLLCWSQGTPCPHALKMSPRDPALVTAFQARERGRRQREQDKGRAHNLSVPPPHTHPNSKIFQIFTKQLLVLVHWSELCQRATADPQYGEKCRFYFLPGISPPTPKNNVGVL